MRESLRNKLFPLILNHTAWKIFFKDGVVIKRDDSGAEIFPKIIKMVDLSPEEIMEVSSLYNGQLMIEYNEYLKEVDAQERREAIQESGNWSNTVSYMGYFDGKPFIVDTSRDTAIDINYDTWKSIVGADMAKELHRGAGVREYNPTVLNRMRLHEGNAIDDFQKDLPIYNSYIPPQWKLDRVKGKKGAYRKDIQEFFEHFIPDLACREYTFERMMMIVDHKLPIILVMNSLTGTGKGLFVENILRHGVGENNFSNAPVSWDRSGFNAWLGETQIAWMDEAKVNPNGDKENTNLLKRLVNDYQAIEKKGIDVHGSTKVWASVIITNNQGTKNFKLEEDNRRFSVLDVAQEKLKDAMGEERATELAEKIVYNKDGILDEFWLWLSENYSTQKYGGEFALWKGNTYEMFHYESRSLWQKTIIDMCRSGDYYKISADEFYKEVEERSDSKQTRPRIGTIEAFLQEFSTIDGKYLGKLERQHRGWSLLVNKELVKESTLSAFNGGMTEVYGSPKDGEDNTKEAIAKTDALVGYEDLDL